MYLDCDQCDFDYLRTEVTFVDYVRSRQDAAVHILVTSQQTGGGGREYTLTFIGQRQFAGMSDTLRYVAPPAVSPDELRKGLARTIKIGLVRYAAQGHRRANSPSLGWRLPSTLFVGMESAARFICDLRFTS